MVDPDAIEEDESGSPRRESALEETVVVEPSEVLLQERSDGVTMSKL